MKRRIISLCALLCSIAALAGGPELTFKKTSHDFGKIEAKGGRVTAEFPFTNTGDQPLVIVSVTNGGCGCTTPQYPTAPIAPGASGVVKITFDPKGRSGTLNRKVLVQSNAGKKRIGLKFSGTIIPEWKEVPTNP